MKTVQSEAPELDLDGGAQPTAREKAPGAFRTISEVSEELDIPAHVLRFWESKFPQVNPMKRGGGRRYYRPADVALLRGVRKMLYDDGLTIKGLQKVFRERGPRYVVGVGEGVEVAAFDETEMPTVAEAAAVPAAQTEPRSGLWAVIARLETIRDGLRDA
jgi:DNA-binding transcriptional MerR regulator